MPLVRALGFDPIWFGLLVLVNMEIGMKTPPFGMCLFVMKGVASKAISMLDIYKSVIPFILIDYYCHAFHSSFPGPCPVSAAAYVAAGTNRPEINVNCKGKKMIAGKKILVVDDEPDILDTIQELLDMCELTTAGSFEEGKRLLENEDFDIAILDIMGVDGYGLLKIATEKNILAVMLTANALSVEKHRKIIQTGCGLLYSQGRDRQSADLFDRCPGSRGGKESISGTGGWSDLPQCTIRNSARIGRRTIGRSGKK